MRCAALILAAAPAIAHAGPVRVAALAEAGLWATGHATSEHQLGAELVVERDLDDVFRAGAGAELLEAWYRDDECYGWSGQVAGAFASLGLREPTAKEVHVFVAGRLGMRGARLVPSCYPTSPVRFDSWGYAGVVFGIDLGRHGRRARIQAQLVRIFVPNPPDVELAVGLGGSF